ncbi:MAG TPA: hypothetical protein VJA25_10075 [Dehalococcoidia bacterium]|nr:hypothetical protein [Dehalococcoidia bacterium]
MPAIGPKEGSPGHAQFGRYAGSYGGGAPGSAHDPQGRDNNARRYQASVQGVELAEGELGRAF